MTFLLYSYIFLLAIFSLSSQSLSVQKKIQNLKSVKTKLPFVNLEFHSLNVKDSNLVVLMRISFLHLPDDVEEDFDITNQKIHMAYTKIKLDIEEMLKRSQIRYWKWTKENLNDFIKLNDKSFRITYSNLVYTVPR